MVFLTKKLLLRINITRYNYVTIFSCFNVIFYYYHTNFILLYEYIKMYFTFFIVLIKFKWLYVITIEIRLMVEIFLVTNLYKNIPICTLLHEKYNMFTTNNFFKTKANGAFPIFLLFFFLCLLNCLFLFYNSNLLI